MIKAILLVGSGSFLGGISRYLLGQYIGKFPPMSFPMSTMAINIAGCFTIGVFLGLGGKYTLPPEWRLFLATGFCGGFTTFSAFAFENIILIQQQQHFQAILYAMLSLALGALACYGGLFLAKLL